MVSWAETSEQSGDRAGEAKEIGEGMAAYTGECEIEVPGEETRTGWSSLFLHDDGSWAGQLKNAETDWFGALHRRDRITIRLPWASGVVVVNHFTYFLPTQAHVTGIGAPPISKDA